MSRKNIFSGPASKKVILRALALVPVFVLCLVVASHLVNRPAFEAIHQGRTGGPNEAALSADLQDWRALSWEEKEQLVRLAVAYFREQMNCAILKSPGHYVVLVDRLLQAEPSVRDKNLLTVLHGLAIRDYDFYSGTNADEQALKFLGPELFQKNLELRQAEDTKIRPVDVKK